MGGKKKQSGGMKTNATTDGARIIGMAIGQRNAAGSATCGECTAEGTLADTRSAVMLDAGERKMPKVTSGMKLLERGRETFASISSMEIGSPPKNQMHEMFKSLAGADEVTTNFYLMGAGYQWELQDSSDE